MNEKQSELVKATIALDEELEKVERLAQAAARTPLSSQRNLEKAARTTNEAAQAQLQVGERIKVMLEALNIARERNEATLSGMQSHSQEIKRRSDELTVLLTRFGAIGQEAREITAMIQVDPSGKNFAELEVRMGAIAESARILWQEANDGHWGDLARDADALRQQVLGAKNKLGLIAKRLTPPS